MSCLLVSNQKMEIFEMFEGSHYWTLARNDIDGNWLELNCITENGTSAKVIGEKPVVPGLKKVRILLFERL